MKTEEAREKEKEVRRNTSISKLKRRSLCSATVEWKRGLCDGEQLLSPPLRRGWGDRMLQLLISKFERTISLFWLSFCLLWRRRRSHGRERARVPWTERVRFVCMLLLSYWWEKKLRGMCSIKVVWDRKRANSRHGLDKGVVTSNLLSFHFLLLPSIFLFLSISLN